MLAIFLVIGIVVGVFIAKLVRSLRRIADKGVLIADKAETAVSNLQTGAGVAGIARGIDWFMKMFTKSKRGE